MRRKKRLAAIGARRLGADPAVEREVAAILEAVRSEGDAALVRYTQRFDSPGFDAGRITVSQSEMDAACASVDAGFLGNPAGGYRKYRSLPPAAASYFPVHHKTDGNVSRPDRAARARGRALHTRGKGRGDPAHIVSNL